MFAASSQILELVEEPCGFPPQFYEVHHQLALPPFPFHRGLCPAGHAALRRTVSNISNLSCALSALSSSFHPSTTQHRHTYTHTSFPLLLFPSLHLTLLPACDPWPGVAVVTDVLTQQEAGRAAAPTAAL